MTHANGNGQLLPPSKRPVTPPPPLELERVMEPPAWLKAIREGMANSLEAEDLKAVMQKQVEKAKGGDTKAAEFVFDQAHKMMRSEQPRQVTITQNNNYDSPRPEAPIEPGDGASGMDLIKMRSRARAGLPLAGPGDARTRPVSDEEEKEIRRQQEQDLDA